MPIYTFKDNETGEEFDKMMKMSELDEYKEANPHLSTVIRGAPAFSYDSVGLGVRKTDDSFNSLLKHIKKGNSKGKTDSTIQTR